MGAQVLCKHKVEGSSPFSSTIIEQASAECRKLVKNMVTAWVLEIWVRLPARP